MARSGSTSQRLIVVLVDAYFQATLAFSQYAATERCRLLIRSPLEEAKL